MDVRIGTAGWSIPRIVADAFPEEGTALARYAARFDAVEINSSFHRPHRASTWARWAASVPDCFRFAVKLPKTITHQAKLAGAASLTEQFLEDVAGLGDKLAILLVQLPPKLAFDAAVADAYFSALRAHAQAQIACEPRHASWFEDEADALLRRLRIARVAADPALCPAAATPGGHPGLAYWRLHGSPAMYRSPYSQAALDLYADRIGGAVASGTEAWCMFDNTAASAATGDALALQARLRILR